MAITQGHGNPKWTREETILALELYHELDGRIPSGNNPKIHALSTYLRSLPYHATSAKKDSFRNHDGVAFKLLNLRSVALGKGLSNISSMDREIWNELGNKTSKTKELANLIRDSIEILNLAVDDGEELEFTEGKAVTRLHSRKERNPKIRKQLLILRKKKGRLYCDICGTTHTSNNADIQDSIFEAHHIIPISISQSQITKLSDMALLCANCHRLLHKAIAKEKRWLSVFEAQKIIYSSL